MKKVMAAIAVVSMFGFSAQAQNYKKNQDTDDKVQAELTFSPSIKAYGCVLEVDTHLIHIKDISFTNVIPVAQHDVRGTLFVHTPSGNVKSLKTVNDHYLFKKHFMPLWTKCKHPEQVKPKSRSNSHYDY